jgi:hypothetical protein
MVGKDIYTNCGMVGQTEWPDGVVRRSGLTERPNGVARQRSPRYPIGEQGRRTTGWVPNGGWTSARRRGTGARQRALGCPTKTRSAQRRVSRSGPTVGLGGDPTGDYIRAGGPPFWALSSYAQLHLQEMRERRVLMSESGPLRGEFRKECSPPHCFYN